jgi:hypothetical protein
MLCASVALLFASQAVGAPDGANTSGPVIYLGPAPASSPAQAAQPPVAPAAPPTPTTIKVPEGTEVHLHLAEQLSSATANAGETFSIVTDQEITLPDGTVLPAGYSGKGEITQVEKAGMLGKPGSISIRLIYMKVGGVHVRLRSNRSGEGKSNVTAMVVTTVLLTGLGLFIRGHSFVFPKGQPLVGYVDDDFTLPLPIAPPPALD